MNTPSNINNVQSNLTLQGTFWEILTSLLLIAGAKASDWLGAYLYPTGVPFMYSVILLARDFATLLYVIGITLRYVRFAYHQFSQTLNGILSSKFWIRISKGIFWISRKATYFWGELDFMSRKLVLMILIVLFAFGFFGFSRGEFYFIFPIAYWGVTFLLAQVFEWKGKKPRRSYWLLAFLLFLSILLWTFTIDINNYLILEKLDNISNRITQIIIYTQTFIYNLSRNIDISTILNTIGRMSYIDKVLLILFGFLSFWIIKLVMKNIPRKFKSHKIFKDARCFYNPFKFLAQSI